MLPYPQGMPGAAQYDNQAHYVLQQPLALPPLPPPLLLPGNWTLQALAAQPAMSSNQSWGQYAGQQVPPHGVALQQVQLPQQRQQDKNNRHP